MTIHEALPSSGRSRLLLAAALIAVLVLAGTGAALWRPLTALAHHNEYKAEGTCAGWTAHAGYVGGSGERLVVIEQVVVGGQPYQTSWSTGFATGSGTSNGIQQYTGGNVDGKPFKSGEQPSTTNTYYWFGVDNSLDPNRPSGTSYDWTIFSLTGTWPAGSFSGRIYLYQVDGSEWKRIGTVDVTAPKAPTDCKFKVCKLVESNGDGQVDGGQFSFEITIGNGQPQAFTLTDSELSGGACEEFSAPAGSSATVTEKQDRPADWLADEPGYPKYSIEGGTPVSGSTASLQFAGSGKTAEVEFRNKEIRSRKLEICKKVESDGQNPSKEKWNFTFTAQWTGGSASVTVENVEEGKSECEKIEVPEDADVTVTESGRPAGWTGDAPGYPKWEVKSGSSGTGETAIVPENKNKVTFTNKELPQGNIQVHKYLPKDNPPQNAPWENQGNGQGQWQFTVYGSETDAQNETNPLATFSQLGTNSPDLPQTDLWIKETGMPSGYQFFGWFVPDADNNSGNDKCNQQPLDGSTLDASPILHIPASYWDTKGNKTGLLHICAYNKPATRTVRVIKVVEGTYIPAGTHQFGGAVGSHTWSVSLTDPSSGSEQPAGDFTVPTSAVTVDETTLPTGWSLEGFAVLQGLQQSCANVTSYSPTSATVPAGSESYTVCVKNTSQVLPTGDIIVHKYKGQPGDASTPLSGWTISISNPPGGSQQTDGEGKVVFAGLNPGTYTVCETLQTGWTFKGARVNGQDASASENGNQRCVDVEIPQSGGDVTVDFWNDRSQTITFIKVECPSYALVPRNGGSGPDHVGLPDDVDDLVTGADLRPQAPADGKDVVTPSVIPPECKRVSGWNFYTWRKNPNESNPQQLGSYTTGADGSVVANLSEDELDEIFGSNLWISEELRSGWGFGSLKCYDDHLNEDNSEFIKLTEPRDNVYCIAFNVRSGTVGGYKIHDLDGDGDWDGGEPGLEGWTITATRADNGKSVSTTTASDGSFSFTNLPAGQYKVCETLQPGWTQTAPGGDGCFTVAVGGGNPDPEKLIFLNANNGTLEICKEWRANDDGITEDPFPWEFDVGGDDQADVTIAVGEGQQACDTLTLPAGDYTVAELDARPSGYVDADGFPKHRVGDAGSFTSGDEAEVTVEPDGSTKVTFRNKGKNRTATLKICKTVEENGDGVTQGGTFSFHYESGDGKNKGDVQRDVSEGETECTGWKTLRAGKTYTVSETGKPAGWVDAAGYPQVQVDGGTPASGDSVEIGPVEEGDEIVVTFINRHGAGELVICKDWKTNIDAVTEPAFAWQFDYDGQAGADVSVSVAEGESGCAEPVTVPAGSYTVSELGDRPSGWPGDHEDGYPRYSLDGGSNYTVGNSVAVTVEDGGKTTVWFRNRAKNRQATLTVCKVVEENGDGVDQSGTFSVSWESVSPTGDPGGVDLEATEGAPASCKSRTVRAGYTYDVSEELPSGWESDSGYPKVQVGDGTPAEGSSVQVGPFAEGQEVVVTFYNKHVPATGLLIVKKVVVNVDGDDTEFDITVTPLFEGGTGQNGTIRETDADGTSFTLHVGSYEVEEADEPGYSELGWQYGNEQGDCPAWPAGNGGVQELQAVASSAADVDVHPGETVVLCFYNEKHGEVTVTKSNDVNGTTTPGGSFTWTITVTVTGGPLGSDVVISDTLPTTGLAYGAVSADPAFKSCDLTPPDISCTLPAGTAEGSYEITMPVTVESSFDACGPHTNTVTAAVAGGPELQDRDTVTVSCVAGSGTIIVKKVVVEGPADTTFTATVSGAGSRPFSTGSSALFPGLDAGTYTVTETAPSGWTNLGTAVLEGDSTCPREPTGGAAAAVNVTVEDNQWTVCFYNRTLPPPTGSVWVRKVVLDEQGAPDPTDQQLFLVNIDGYLFNGTFNQSSPAAVQGLSLGTTVSAAEHDASGYLEMGYVVVPGANAVCPVEGVAPIPGVASVTIENGGLDWTICFYNQREERRTPTPPVTPSPTETPTEPASETPTPTPVETVAGEQTPGPAATVTAPTPAPPSTGTGTTAGGGAGAAAMLLAGLVTVSSGAAFLVLGRRRS